MKKKGSNFLDSRRKKERKKDFKNSQKEKKLLVLERFAWSHWIRNNKSYHRR